jgi:hypothetical protein
VEAEKASTPKTLEPIEWAKVARANLLERVHLRFAHNRGHCGLPLRVQTVHPFFIPRGLVSLQEQPRPACISFILTLKHEL